MLALTLSDTHCQQYKLDLPPADILIHSGDLTFKGNTPELTDVFQWFDVQVKNDKYDRILFSAGNHDFFMETRLASIRPLFSNEPRISYLQGSGVTYKGIKFWGEATTPWFHSWAFNVHRGTPEMKAIWQKMPLDTDVLITHGPPRGYGDINREDGSCGCDDQLDRLLEVKPKVVVCGHIHEGRGVYPMKDCPTLIVNTSICTRDYQPTNSPYLIDIDEETKEVRSIIEVYSNTKVYSNEAP